jgi:broad specificity phosphatase PhoE
MADPAQIWLARHGETEWSRTGRHTGRTDIELTETGREQAKALAPALAEQDFSRVISSPLSRALETCRLALPFRSIEPSEALLEWDYGAYEGLTSKEIRERRPGWVLWRDGCPGGETAAEVGARADRMLARIRDALATGPVVTVGHGHFSRVLAARWLGLPVAGGAMFVLGPASPCVLGTEHGQPAVHRWNVPNPAERDTG